MTEQEMFKKIVDEAIAHRSDTPPENPAEFQVYSDSHYNLYMFVKGEWINLGLNMTPLN